VLVVRDLDRDRRTGTCDPVDLLHDPDRVREVLDHVDRHDLVDGIVAEGPWKTTEVADQIDTGEADPVDVHVTRTDIAPASEVQSPGSHEPAPRIEGREPARQYIIATSVARGPGPPHLEDDAMRVAIFYDYLQTIGGGERVALTLAQHLDADLITTEPDPGLPERAGFPGVRVVTLGRILLQPPLKQIHASWRFARAGFNGYDFSFLIGNWAHYAGRRHHPNVYYCLTPTRAFYDQRSAMLARLPAPNRWVARTWSTVHGHLERRSVGRCDRIVAISRTVRERVRRYYGRESNVIYPPVATRRHRFKELGDFWLSVSRMYPEKRIELQLDIFRRLPGEKLVLVGGYSAGDRAERYLASLNPPENVTLLGEISEDRLVDLYARCRGFITTAVDEDFGITPVEAMAAGKCVLATNEGGYRETVVDGMTGFLLPADANAFATKLRELDDSRLSAMRDTCVARAREFDEAVFVSKMRAFLE